MSDTIPCSASCGKRSSDSPYRFPPTKWVLQDDWNGLWSQQRKVSSECDELENALFDAQHEVLTLDDAADEALDVIHAAETMLRQLEGNGVDVTSARTRVEAKNRARGYYATD